MALTTEKLNEIYENPEQCSYSEIQEMAAMLANRETQPVAYIADCGTIVSDSDPFFDDYKNPQPLYITPLAPAVPQAITAANAPEVFEIAAEVERLGLRGAYGAYAVGWNACRAAMLVDVKVEGDA